MKTNSSLSKFFKSFVYAYRGVKYCIKNERNMRFHLVVTIYLFIFSFFYTFTKTEWCLLALAISSVLASEIINTSIERIVDLISPNYNKLAEIAKDTAAGAVLVSAIFSVVIGINLYFKKAVILSIYHFFINNPFLAFALIISLIISFIFIFYGFKNHKNV